MRFQNALPSSILNLPPFPPFDIDGVPSFEICSPYDDYRTEEPTALGSSTERSFPAPWPRSFAFLFVDDTP